MKKKMKFKYKDYVDKEKIYMHGECDMFERISDKKRNMVIFAGVIGAGKTTASKYIVNRYDYVHLSYVDLIWLPILEKRKLPATRKNFQDLGDELRETYGIRGLARKIIPFIPENTSVVIDDIRHPDVYDELKKSIDLNMYLLFIESDITTRALRLKTRDNLGTINELLDIQKRKSETSIDDLEPLADFVIMNDGNLEKFHQEIDECMKLIKRG